jgi:DNA-binding FadR family transcriptional regulator
MYIKNNDYNKLFEVHGQFHKIIFEAIKNKDTKLADKIMKEHLNMVIFDEEKLIESYLDYLKKE